MLQRVVVYVRCINATHHIISLLELTYKGDQTEKITYMFQKKKKESEYDRNTNDSTYVLVPKMGKAYSILVSLPWFHFKYIYTHTKITNKHNQQKRCGICLATAASTKTNLHR